MRGTLYGVGVGPGDPKLMTFLAAETIRKCSVIAVPDRGMGRKMSWQIAKGILTDLDKKECLNLSIPMTKDSGVLEKRYELAAAQLAEKLEEGADIAYLTLGDPTIYSTYIYLHRAVKKLGYDARIISGVPSFCAVSARLGDSLADRSQQLHIIPSSYDIEEALGYGGTKILMKAASRLPQVKQALKARDMKAVMVENCGMDDERIYEELDAMPGEAGYYTVVVVKEPDPFEA